MSRLTPNKPSSWTSRRILLPKKAGCDRVFAFVLASMRDPKVFAPHFGDQTNWAWNIAVAGILLKQGF
jgi:hypothetical protein